MFSNKSNALPCHGDSGSPLFYEEGYLFNLMFNPRFNHRLFSQQQNHDGEDRYLQVGIVSFSNAKCGIMGSDVRFQKVQTVLPWIKKMAGIPVKQG